MTFTASATAQGYTFTNNKTLVTSTASASATSDISYDDALNKATELAQEEANVNALYDANLINQAVSETQQLQNYNMTQINSAPDLTFYFSVLHNNNFISNLGNIGVSQITFGTIYSDIDLTQKIGDSIIQKTISTKNNNGFYTYAGTRTYFLPNGTLNWLDNNISILNSAGNYVTPKGKYLIQIVSGSGEYLNKTGIVENIIDETTTRTVNVYFNN